MLSLARPGRGVPLGPTEASLTSDLPRQPGPRLPFPDFSFWSSSPCSRTSSQASLIVRGLHGGSGGDVATDTDVIKSNPGLGLRSQASLQRPRQPLTPGAWLVRAMQVPTPESFTGWCLA